MLSHKKSKYAVKKGAFDNFLIFDIGVKKYLQDAGALTIHEKISDISVSMKAKDYLDMPELIDVNHLL